MATKVNVAELKLKEDGEAIDGEEERRRYGSPRRSQQPIQAGVRIDYYLL